MNNRITISALVLCLAAGCLLLTGCGQQQTQNNQGNTSDRGGEQQAATPEGAPQDQGEQQQQEESASISSILDRSSDMGSVAYDMNVKSPTRNDYSSRVWLEGDNMRVESTMSTQGGTFESVYLLDMAEQTSYVYMPEQGRAMKMGYSQAKEKAGDSPRSQNSTIRQNDPEVVGHETLNGKECVVVEYVPDSGNKTKAWIWEEHGFPIKTVSNTNKGEYVTEMTNIDFGDIPDSKFELPEGVQVMDMPAGIPSGSDIPAGMDSGNIPDMEF